MRTACADSPCCRPRSIGRGDFRAVLRRDPGQRFTGWFNDTVEVMTVDTWAARIRALPGVTETRIEPDSGMPPYTWDDRFFFAGEDRMRPFATIVGHDVPDFDTLSDLDRPGVHRLNIEVGRSEFTNLFGYGPEQFSDRRPGIDFTVADRLIPHPAYGVQGWASVVQPGPATFDEVGRLLEHARSRSVARLARMRTSEGE
ncbi:DUF6194 family protein [Actinoplanes rectilineatus]|uniref:DUF6194 family protein n=1 Tax=Actinoplanes rectilineatus TaxID=113571 RepID=UPI002480CC75|nr:DUF6194 family protein [Actinoplanes rectilineatus]